VFDLAGARTKLQPFEERYQLVCELIARDHPFLVFSTFCLFLFFHSLLLLLSPSVIYPSSLCHSSSSLSLPHSHLFDQILAFRLQCTTSPTLIHLSSMVIGEGGEGLILRKPKSHYIQGRSPFLLKYKVFKNLFL